MTRRLYAHTGADINPGLSSPSRLFSSTRTTLLPHKDTACEMHRPIISSFAKFRSCRLITKSDLHFFSTAARLQTKKKAASNGDKGPIDLFFAKYPGFNHKTAAPIQEEFKSLCTHCGWGRKSKRRRQARCDFHDAVRAEFETTYETDPGSLLSWQKLCHAGEISVHNKDKGHSKVRNASV